jgi:hypothetical protein
MSRSYARGQIRFSARVAVARLVVARLCKEADIPD